MCRYISLRRVLNADFFLELSSLRTVSVKHACPVWLELLCEAFRKSGRVLEEFSVSCLTIGGTDVALAGVLSDVRFTRRLVHAIRPGETSLVMTRRACKRAGVEFVEQE